MGVLLVFAKHLFEGFERVIAGTFNPCVFLCLTDTKIHSEIVRMGKQPIISQGKQILHQYR